MLLGIVTIKFVRKLNYSCEFVIHPPYLTPFSSLPCRSSWHVRLLFLFFRVLSNFQQIELTTSPSIRHLPRWLCHPSSSLSVHLSHCPHRHLLTRLSSSPSSSLPPPSPPSYSFGVFCTIFAVIPAVTYSVIFPICHLRRPYATTIHANQWIKCGPCPQLWSANHPFAGPHFTRVHIQKCVNHKANGDVA